MNLNSYIDFYVDDEDHWYITKVKQITEASINEMTNGLSLLYKLLRPNPDGSLIAEFENFIPQNTQLKIFDDEDQTRQIKVNKYSKIFLSIKILSEGLVSDTQVIFKNPRKHLVFQRIIDEFRQNKNYLFFEKEYTEQFLIRELEVYYRNFESWLSKFGFMGRIDTSDYCFFTEVGVEFAQSSNDIDLSSAIFLNQIKKMQVWNPTMHNKYSQIKVVPYFLLLDILLHLDENKFNKTEYVLFITKLKSHDRTTIKNCVRLVNQFRRLSREGKAKYVERIKKKDLQKYPSRDRPNFDRLYDSSTKEISAYTFGSITVHNEHDHFFKLINKEKAIVELKQFNSSPKYLEIRKKEDWIRHLGSLNGLSVDDILQIYIHEGKTFTEILQTFDTSDILIEQKIKEKLFEKEIEDYYEENLHEINPDLEIVRVPYGRQFATPIGPIDILCQHKTSKEYYVLEFKRSQVSDDTIGQILRYMGWIYLSMERSKKTVNGIIVGNEFPDKLYYALHGIQSPHIYRITALHKHLFTEKNKPPN